ncbi:MAG: hypothetical protein HFJ80_04420 [Clostridiales bacterium]|nr:hypothetical protein [Clostridiales bacterium]
MMKLLIGRRGNRCRGRVPGGTLRCTAEGSSGPEKISRTRTAGCQTTV